MCIFLKCGFTHNVELSVIVAICENRYRTIVRKLRRLTMFSSSLSFFSVPHPTSSRTPVVQRFKTSSVREFYVRMFSVEGLSLFKYSPLASRDRASGLRLRSKPVFTPSRLDDGNSYKSSVVQLSSWIRVSRSRISRAMASISACNADTLTVDFTRISLLE